MSFNAGIHSLVKYNEVNTSNMKMKSNYFLEINTIVTSLFII